MSTIFLYKSFVFKELFEHSVTELEACMTTQSWQGGRCESSLMSRSEFLEQRRSWLC